MLTAIRRTKSLSAWLTMIVAIVVVSVSSVLMMSGLSQPHVDQDTAAVTGVSTRGGLHSDTTVDTTATAAPARVTVGSSTTVSPRLSDPALSNAAMAPNFPMAGSASSASLVGSNGAASSAATEASAALNAGGAPALDAAPASTLSTHPDKVVTPADASARKAAARTAARVAARRQAAVEAARINRSLRADIALYNAERMAGLDRPQKLVPLPTASVPHTHSLWDEVPAPLSNLYRN